MKFVVKKSGDEYLYLKLTFTSPIKIEWVTEVKEATKYTSRYSAKKQLKVLDGIPQSVILFPI